MCSEDTQIILLLIARHPADNLICEAMKIKTLKNNVPTKKVGCENNKKTSTLCVFYLNVKSSIALYVTRHTLND